MSDAMRAFWANLDVLWRMALWRLAARAARRTRRLEEKLWFWLGL